MSSSNEASGLVALLADDIQRANALPGHVFDKAIGAFVDTTLDRTRLTGCLALDKVAPYFDGKANLDAQIKEKVAEISQYGFRLLNSYKITSNARSIRGQADADRIDMAVVGKLLPFIKDQARSLDTSVDGFVGFFFNSDSCSDERECSFKVYTAEPMDGGGVIVTLKFYKCVCKKYEGRVLFVNWGGEDQETIIISLKYLVPKQILDRAGPKLEKEADRFMALFK